ncbi:hypothetical protein, partial [Acinetobacter baumannii]|uniref:hypothetical protein n=1 Tax=Acinetobacter baumannii TaxID=470 RepID=UPI0031F368A9
LCRKRKQFFFMQILLANAKIMYTEAQREPLSEPLFQSTAHALAAEMSALSIEELAKELDCSRALPVLCC